MPIFIDDKPIFTEEYDLIEKQAQERRGFSHLKKLKELIIGSGDAVFRGDARGIWLGAANFSDAPFKVNMDGSITCSAITITGGTMTLDSSGFIRGGQTAYNTGVGFFLGYDATAYKLSIGNPAGDHLTWNGSILRIAGTLSAATIDTRVAAGSQVIAAGGGTYTQTVGFRIRTVYCFASTGASVAAFGIYADGNNFATREGSTVRTDRCWTTTGPGLGGLINNVTATGFDMVGDNTGTGHTVYYIAMG